MGGLKQLGEEIDAFYGRFISHIRDNELAAWFGHERRQIEREYDRVVGYARGYKEAMSANSDASYTTPPLVTESIRLLEERLAKLALDCADANGGRPNKTAIQEPDLGIALRARALWRSVPFGNSLRQSIIQAIAESCEENGPLPVTTTPEGHIRRIRRIVNGNLLPSE